MKKYRVKTHDGVLGPFLKEQLLDLKRKGRIKDFEVQTFPGGDWLELGDHPDFKQEQVEIKDSTVIMQRKKIKEMIEKKKKKNKTF